MESGKQHRRNIAAALVLGATVCAFSDAAMAATATLKSSTSQTIKGWGLSAGWTGRADRSNGAALVFATNFTVGRQGIPVDTGNTDGSLRTDRMTDTKNDIRACQNKGVSVILTTWSPPAYMKLPEQTTRGHSSTGAWEYLNPDYRSAYVQYWIKILKDLTSNSASGSAVSAPIAMSLQNEADFDAPSWDGCNYNINDSTRATYRQLVKDMRAALNSNGFTNVGILAPETEHYSGVFDLLGANLSYLGSDSTLNAAISGLCTHSYDQYKSNEFRTAAAQYGKDTWQTEWSNAVWPESDGDDTKQTVTMMRHLGGDLVDGGINYWFWWGSFNDTNPANTNNECLLWSDSDSNYHFSKKYYVLQKLWGAVRPGWKLKAFNSSDDADLKVANTNDPNPHYVELYGFESGDGTSSVVVAANPTSGNKSFTVNGLKGSSAAVYVTDSTRDMANTSNPSVSGGSLTVTLPGNSVTIIATGSAITPAFAGNVTSVRFYPRTDQGGRMNGGKFQGSTTADFSSGVTDLARVNGYAPNAWTKIDIVSNTKWRYLRYLSPDGGYGNVAEVEFYNGSTKLTGTVIGTSGSYNNSGNTRDKVFDNNTSTFFDAATANGNWAGLDLGGGTTGPGPNLLSNPGFEAEQYGTQTPSGWSEWSSIGGTGSGYTQNNGVAHGGSYYGVHWSGSAYNMYTFQTKTGLANGLYTLRAWVQSSSGQNTAQLEAKDHGDNGSKQTKALPANTSWNLIEIKDINVTNGQCTIGFWSDSPAGKWICFDDVEFFKQ